MNDKIHNNIENKYFDYPKFKKYFNNRLNADTKNLIQDLNYIKYEIQNNSNVKISNLLNDKLIKRLLKLDDFNLTYVAEFVVGIKRSVEFMVIIKNWFS